MYHQFKYKESHQYTQQLLNLLHMYQDINQYIQL